LHFLTLVGKVPERVNSPDITSRLAHTGQLLVRSGIEIDRILSAIAEDGDTVSANLPSKTMFLSRLVFVEPVKQFMLMSYSDHKPANAEILGAKKPITFKCNHRGAQFAFSCNSPRQALHEREPAIQLGMPTTMLALLHRRGLQRVQVPAQAQVDCLLRMGVLSFDARLVDVSMDGMGFLVGEDAIPLCAGTRLEGARIRHPQREPLMVDIEVRHVTRITLPDGKRATRIGCRILAGPSDLEELIRLFIIDLQ
jgi:c-di-GMP-binding flagellar brake protein YcgR